MYTAPITKSIRPTNSVAQSIHWWKNSIGFCCGLGSIPFVMGKQIERTVRPMRGQMLVDFAMAA